MHPDFRSTVPGPFLSPCQIVKNLETIEPDGLKYSNVGIEVKGLLIEQIKEMREYIRGVDWSTLTDSLPEGILHSDIHDENVLFAPAHQISGVIDWEDICVGPLVMDLAMAAANWCFTLEGEWDVGLYQQFLAAYQHHRRLSEREKELLWPLVILGGLNYFAYHYHHPELEQEVHYLLDFTGPFHKLWKRNGLE